MGGYLFIIVDWLLSYYIGISMFNAPVSSNGYSGIENILLSTSYVVIMFYLKINNIIIQKTIKFLSKYTLGIYCLHVGIGNLLISVFKD